MGKRYYDPIGGRFISPDPLGHEASMDLYSYAGGDPVNFVDPTGRFEIHVVERGPDGTHHTTNIVTADILLNGIQYGVENNLVAEGLANVMTESFVDSSFGAAMLGAGEGFQAMPDTLGATAGFFLADGPGQVTVTLGLGLAGAITWTRAEAGGDVQLTDIAAGFGVGVSVDYSPEFSPEPDSTFSQTISISASVSTVSGSYQVTTTGDASGQFGYTAQGELATAKPGVSLAVQGSVNFSVDLTNIESATLTGELQPSLKLGYGVGLGAFGLIDWDGPSSEEGQVVPPQNTPGGISSPQATTSTADSPLDVVNGNNPK